MRVFIVGATGVIGRALIPRLLARGDRVVALVRSRVRAAPIALPGVELVEGDLLQVPEGDLAAILDGCEVAAHMATALRPGSPGLGTTNTMSAIRIEGTRRLLDAALRVGVAHYIQQGIALAYEDGGDRWLDEATPFSIPDPAAPPAHVEMERMVTAVDAGRMRWTILRGGSFVGPDTFQERTIARLRSGEEHVPGDGLHWVSYVHVEDYAEAVTLATRSSAATAVLNITDEPIQQGRYLDRLAEIEGVPPPARDPQAPRPRSCRCTSAAARDLLGWQPTHGIWPA